MWDWLGKLLGGAGNLIGSAGSGINKLFGGGGGGGMSSVPMGGRVGSGFNVGGMNAGNMPMNYGKTGGWGSALSSLFGGKQGLGGMGIMGLSQLIPSKKTYSMPDSYNQFMSQMQAGGTPGMQSANSYWQNILSGKNRNAYDAATYSIDQTYEEEKRNLISMYKSLRPGTDLESDATFRRDMDKLEGDYARNRAMVSSGVQTDAAKSLAGLGTQQMAGLTSGIQAQIDAIASQWGMSASQREALKNYFLSMGGDIFTNAIDPSTAIYEKLFGKMFGGV